MRSTRDTAATRACWKTSSCSGGSAPRPDPCRKTGRRPFSAKRPSCFHAPSHQMPEPATTAGRSAPFRSSAAFITSRGSPKARRAPSALLVRRGGERLLFDCAEGTQRQLLRSAIGLIELPEVFLTHYHADHYLGLPGMLKTFALRGRELPLTIYGPPGLADLFGALRRIFGRLSYELQLLTPPPGDA